MATKQYKVNQGGSYYVAAVNGNVKKNSNTVNVDLMECVVNYARWDAPTEPDGAFKCTVDFNITNPIVGATIIVQLLQTSYTKGTSVFYFGSAYVAVPITSETHYTATFEAFIGEEPTLNGFKAGTIGNMVSILRRDDDRNGTALIDSIEAVKLPIIIHTTIENYTLDYSITALQGSNVLPYRIFTEFGLTGVDGGTSVKIPVNSDTAYPVTGTVATGGRYVTRVVEVAHADDICNISFVQTIVVEELSAPVLTYDAAIGALKWESVAGAEKYEVYRDGVKIGEVQQT